MSPNEAQSLVDRWNRKHKVGAEVYVLSHDVTRKTRSLAFVENGLAMVRVEGVKEPVGLEGVECV